VKLIQARVRTYHQFTEWNKDEKEEDVHIFPNITGDAVGPYSESFKLAYRLVVNEPCIT